MPFTICFTDDIILFLCTGGARNVPMKRVLPSKYLIQFPLLAWVDDIFYESATATWCCKCKNWIFKRNVARILKTYFSSALTSFPLKMRKLQKNDNKIAFSGVVERGCRWEISPPPFSVDDIAKMKEFFPIYYVSVSFASPDFETFQRPWVLLTR